MYGLLINISTVCGVRVGMCALWSTQECPAETGLHQCNVGWNLKCLWSIVLWQGFILPWSPPYLLQNASSLRSQLHAAVFLKKRTFIFFFSSFLPPGNSKDVKILRSWNVTPDIVRCSFAVQKCCWNATMVWCRTRVRNESVLSENTGWLDCTFYADVFAYYFRDIFEHRSMFQWLAIYTDAASNPWTEIFMLRTGSLCYIRNNETNHTET